MSELIPIRRALLSVSDKTDLVPFARGLAELGVAIISTGGTAKALTDAGIQVTPIDEVTGMPEMMDGRVKTLHPRIHGALLGRPGVAEHRKAMEEHGIQQIELVCINLYPFEQTIQAEGVSVEQCIEQIDIGGPAMIRSAAKNHESVAVVTSPRQYDSVMTALRDNDGSTTPELRRELAAAAFTRTAEYDTAISAWMSSKLQPQFPYTLRLSYAHQQDLRYGENPHQQAALYDDARSNEPCVGSASVLHGKALSYNNLADAAAATELVRDLHAALPERYCAAVIKHANPCGAAHATSLADAFERAYAGDPLAAYGGILALSHNVDAETADAIAEGQKFLEVIIAPGFDEAAQATLSTRWKNVRLLALPAMHHRIGRAMDYKSIPGGMLVQQRDQAIPQTTDWIHAAGPAPDSDTLAHAAFIWIVAKHLKSNAVAIGKDGMMLGGGGGQVDRVSSCHLAIRKAADRAEGAIAASDAFFPFADGPEMLIDAGVTCLVHPGGSKRDQDTIDLCNERDVTCLLTGVRHFRH